MNKHILKTFSIFFFSILVISGCKKWEDHNALTDSMVAKDLFQRIQEEPELTQFAELLTKTGYDKIIGSSQTYTVFAPGHSLHIYHLQ